MPIRRPPQLLDRPGDDQADTAHALTKLRKPSSVVTTRRYVSAMSCLFFGFLVARQESQELDARAFGLKPVLVEVEHVSVGQRVADDFKTLSTVRRAIPVDGLGGHRMQALFVLPFVCSVYVIHDPAEAPGMGHFFGPELGVEKALAPRHGGLPRKDYWRRRDLGDDGPSFAHRGS